MTLMQTRPLLMPEMDSLGSDCMTDVSKQRDVSPRFGSGTPAWPSKSVHPQREDILLPNTHTLHNLSILLTFRAAKKTFSGLCRPTETLPLSAYILHSPELLNEGLNSKICQLKSKTSEGQDQSLSFLS